MQKISFSTAGLQLPLRALIAALVLPTLISCAVNPATGGPNLVLMSEKREIEIGKEEHEKVLSSMPVYHDEKLQAYVTKVGNKVAAAGDRPDLEYTFTIIDSPEINAFALPGGYVYVNRGLLTFMNSEADLAAVLGHEVAHITARHGVQQQARGTLARTAAQVGGVVAAVATGSGYVGSQISQVASIWAQTGLSGYGREDELQADSLGAEYIRDAGYDATAMINVVTVLKNQEDFSRQINNGAGGYHGLFASHPRNDTRLQEAIASVAALGDGAARETDNAEFREHINGLILGPSNASQTAETRNRYYQQLLRYTVVFPDDWQISETTTTVTAAQPGVGDMRIETQRLQDNISPREFIRESLGITNLQKSEPLEQYRLLGHTGLVESANGTLERLAVIYYGPRVFVFRGQIADRGKTDEIDEMLLSSVRTFRAIQQGEMVAGSEPRIKYVQASEFFDFAIVAKESRIANYPEETLRLLNGYYPTGKPKAGEWVKLIE